MSKILLVDDEPDILEFLGYNLRHEGYEVHTAGNGREGVSKAKQLRPDLILLDVMMPEMDGIRACREIRKQPELAKTIVAFLTARGEDYSQIAGFDAGADDYIAKPVRPKVLVSRIKALLKRADAPAEQSSVGIQIDRERFVVVKDGKPLALPRKEFELLALLFSKPQRVFTRDEIYTLVWGDDIVVGDRTIDVHIRKLREKIGEEHIATIKGVGYKYLG